MLLCSQRLICRSALGIGIGVRRRSSSIQNSARPPWYGVGVIEIMPKMYSPDAVLIFFSCAGGSVLDQETLLLTLIEASIRSTAPADAAPGEYTFDGFSSFSQDPLADPDDCDERGPGAVPGSRVSGLVLARALLAERTALRTGSAQVGASF